MRQHGAALEAKLGSGRRAASPRLCLQWQQQHNEMNPIKTDDCAGRAASINNLGAGKANSRPVLSLRLWPSLSESLLLLLLSSSSSSIFPLRSSLSFLGPAPAPLTRPQAPSSSHIHWRARTHNGQFAPNSNILVRAIGSHEATTIQAASLAAAAAADTNSYKK